MEPPPGYPDDPQTHHIANYYPQDIEQPVEIAFYDKNGKKNTYDRKMYLKKKVVYDIYTKSGPNFLSFEKINFQ